MFLSSVQPFLQDGASPEDSYRLSLAAIHERAVTDAVASAAPNRILGQPAPPVHAEEANLPRPFRSALAQLRSGFSSAMGDYLFRIGRLPSPICPECNTAEHTVPHLFSCTAHPTDLCPADLWERPREVAVFISSLPSFDHLPALPCCIQVILGRAVYLF